jgi:hypothetical protein
MQIIITRPQKTYRSKRCLLQNIPCKPRLSNFPWVHKPKIRLKIILNNKSPIISLITKILKLKKIIRFRIAKKIKLLINIKIR